MSWGLADAWDEHAAAWITWTRSGIQHEGFEVTWPALRSVLPSPTGVTLEVGCGEGRATRNLMADGHTVVAVERSATLARAARTAGPPVAVAQGDAGRLPFPDASVSLVVACMVLMDLDDLNGAVAEIGRVLHRDGSLCFSLVHPFGSAYDFSTGTITRPYLEDRCYTNRIDRDGVAMTFVSAHRPLSAYMTALHHGGLALTHLREGGDQLVPWLLVGRAMKLPEI